MSAAARPSLAAPAAAPARAHDGAGRGSLPGEAPTVVIVDDSIANLAIYARLVGSVAADADIRRFAESRDALAWLTDNPADLVVTDYLMPELHGAELTRRIRDLPLLGDVPVIIVTAHADREFRLRAFTAGASDFVQSPIDHSEFRMRVRNLLQLGIHQRLIRERAAALEQELRQTAAARDQVLRDSRERLAQVIDTIPAMISATDNGGHEIFVNAYRARLMARRMVAPEEVERAARQDQIVLASAQPLAAFEEEVVLDRNETRVFLTTKTPLRDGSGAISGVLSMSLDITERKRAEAQLAFQARHDFLTSLPNRSSLFQRMRQELALGPRPDGRLMALHFIDLDRFKYINDGLGHHVGDRLLQAVAERLRGAIRGGDVIARLGGDEFAVLQPDIASVAVAENFAVRLNRLLGEPFVIDGRELAISASIGVALSRGGDGGPEELLRDADLAMYRIKAAGRNGYQFFAADMLAQARSEVAVQAALRGALARGAFELLFQPLVELRQGEVIGAEALIRWRREDGSLALPGAFLPVAAESGLLGEIDDWVLHAACHQARDWLDQLGRPVRISVNIGVLHARAGGLKQRVLAALDAAGLPPELLELELTEGVLLADAPHALADLEALHRLGVRIAIDDFGTGYSSLASRSGLRADRVNIDKSFVETLVRENSRAIVRAVVSLGRALHLEVLAEGVETEAQLEQLRLAGCDAVQGYLTGAPMSADALLARLQPDPVGGRA